METIFNNNYSVMTVFIPQADDLEVLPGQTDLNSDRGSRYGELILGSLSKDVFEQRTSTGSEDFSLVICLDAM